MNKWVFILLLVSITVLYFGGAYYYFRSRNKKVISNELKMMVDSMPPLTKQQIDRMKELVAKGVSPKLAEMEVRGTLSEDKERELQTVIIREQPNNNLEEKFNVILDLLKENKEFQKKLDEKLQRQAVVYQEKGFTEEEAIKMAQAELLFDIKDSKGLDVSFTNIKEVISSSDDIGKASDFLSQIGE